MRLRVLPGPIAFALALLAGAAGGGAKELTCAFNLTREIIKPAVQGAPGAVQRAASAGPLRTREARRTLVGLAKDYVIATQEAESTIAYHFPSRRMYVLDLREKTYADLSLHGTVAFRVNELLRRRAMQGFAPGPQAAGGVAAGGVMDQFTAESLFSCRLPRDAGRPDAPAAEVIRRGKEWEFRRGDRRFVRFLPSDRPIGPEYTRSWSRFLVVQCSIHPTIREQIVRTGVLPALLEFSYFDGAGSCSVTYRLESAGEGPDRWDGVPPGYTPKRLPGDRIGRILAGLDRGDRRGTLHTRPAAEAFVEGALARGNALDAYLGWSEYGALGGGDAESRASSGRMLAKVLAANDRRVSSLKAGEGGPPDPAAVLKAIDAIDRRGLEKGYQLEAGRGFALTALGRIDEANESLLEALEANPYLLNCYRQLGDNDLRAFRSVEAWRCYDAIRRVDPDSPLLAGVKELEARLEKDFPDDF